MKDPYSILGVSKIASDEEIKSAYRELVRKYDPDNYPDDNPLKDLAAEKMPEIDDAYDEIMRVRESNSSYSGGNSYNSVPTSGIYAEIRRLVSARKFSDAERELSNISPYDRNAEWHYLASVLLMHRGRTNDAMRELEVACEMDPSNIEYQKAKEMFNNSANDYGSNYYGSSNNQPRRNSQDDACNCCANLICLDCLCECLGGDLIRCI